LYIKKGLKKQMVQHEYCYRRKPAFASFLPLYGFCFGLAFLFILYSPIISIVFIKYLLAFWKLDSSHWLHKVPYGIVLSLPFIVFGAHKILWNLMSSYEIGRQGIRLLTGSLIRKERFFSSSDLHEISFSQNVIEAPFGIGMLVIKGNGGTNLNLKGVYGVKSAAEFLRHLRELPFARGLARNQA
jgi:uncharacterized membrane protein YdbT with pleckstrin-like domain